MSATLFDVARTDRGLCRYGVGSGEYPCDRSATHGARWRRGERTGGIDCCRDHANYYASAWAFPCQRGYEYLAGPGEHAAWIEALP